LLAPLTGLAGQRADDHRVQRLLERAVAIDLHADTTQRILDETIDLAKRYDDGQVDIPRMREGGVTAIFFASNPNSRELTPLESIRRALLEIDAVREEVARHPGDLVLAESADDIERAKHQGKIAILIGLEGGHIIDSSRAVLRSLYRLGARYMTLTHFTNTPWADSSGEPAQAHGLTDEGRAIVREMNRLGMMVDISHVSDETFFDALETSEAPIIASHSSVRQFSEHPRNLSDAMLTAIARGGGVVHINYYNPYLDEDYRLRSANAGDLDAKEAALSAKYAGEPKRLAEELRKVNAERIARFGRVSLERLLDHFDHAIQVAGIDHVGLGSDFDGVGDLLPEGMEDVSKIPNLVRGLMERGYSDEDIEKVLGQNTLRVMREVEAVARSKR
jgi:membrane dipeptidase